MLRDNILKNLKEIYAGLVRSSNQQILLINTIVSKPETHITKPTTIIVTTFQSWKECYIGLSNSTPLQPCVCIKVGVKQAYKRDAMLCFQPKDLRLGVVRGVKLSPNIPLRASPCSTNLISFAMMAALSVMRFISLELLHKWLASWSLLRFEFNPIPHFW